MVNDPLDAVFETPEESLARYLSAMPPSLIPVFEREFMRRPKPPAADPGDGKPVDFSGVVSNDFAKNIPVNESSRYSEAG